jgi:ADP-ribose pyrophosphatase YjhB (NUDIX family)
MDVGDEMTQREEPQRIQRTSSRVILINQDERVLLFEGGAEQMGQDRPSWWLPGGGTEVGEDARASAARELHEETGLQVDPAALIGPVALSRGPWRFLEKHYWSEDTFFMLRVPHWEVSRAGWSTSEHDIVTEYRWWSADELRATSDTFYPVDLPGLLEQLFVGDIPAVPLELPWR